MSKPSHDYPIQTGTDISNNNKINILPQKHFVKSYTTAIGLIAIFFYLWKEMCRFLEAHTAECGRGE